MSLTGTRRQALLAAALALGLGPNLTADAASAEANLTVNVTVQSTCTISAAQMDFPSINDPSAPSLATATVNYRCTAGTSPTLYHGQPSIGGTSGPGIFEMAGKDGSTVDLILYRDASRSQVLGNDGSGALALSGTGSSQTAVLYGKVTSNLTSKAGAYQAVIPLIISY